jgi:hypothetical protein
MTMPNFLLIGAAKAGTTSLYHYLRQHPQVYMCPVKEPKFFAFEDTEPGSCRGTGNRDSMSQLITDIEGYRALFTGVSSEKAVGEASPQYLYVPEASSRIRRYVPEARLIAVLRNPVERAYSSYLHLVREGWEQLSFSEALNEEEERVRDNWPIMWHHKNGGFYHEQLKRYYELFEPEQIRVYLYEDLKEDPVGMTQSIFRFLGVDEAFVPDTSLKHNMSGIPKSRALHTLMDLQTLLRRPNLLKSVIKPFVPKRLRLRILLNLRNRYLTRSERPRQRILADLQNRNLTKAPPMPEGVREELTEAYREDVLKLQGLLGRDLSRWLGKEV